MAVLKVAISGWFAGEPVGSGQYTDELHQALAHRPAASGHVTLVRPTRRGQTSKLWFEQIAFPRRASACDVAHIPYWGPPLRATIPVVVTVHDLIPLLLPEYRRGWRLRAYSRLAAAATRRAAAIIADSEHTAADIRRALAIDERRVHVVPLGVAERFAPRALDEGLRERYRLPQRYGLYLGGFDGRKNLATLLFAWREVHAATGVGLVVAGRLPAEERDELDPRAIARSARLGPDAVRFIGPLSERDKPGVYAGSAVFAFPSRYEGFGLPPLEAMACGAPTVVADATSLPEVVGDAGLLVAPSDVAAWIRALRSVLEDGGLADRLRAAGVRRAATFRWSMTAERTWAVYAQARQADERLGASIDSPGAA